MTRLNTGDADTVIRTKQIIMIKKFDYFLQIFHDKRFLYHFMKIIEYKSTDGGKPGWRYTKLLPESPGKIALIVKTAAECQLLDGQRFMLQNLQGGVQFDIHNEFRRRDSLNFMKDL